jgi:hypothetical protein
MKRLCYLPILVLLYIQTSHVNEITGTFSDETEAKESYEHVNEIAGTHINENGSQRSPAQFNQNDSSSSASVNSISGASSGD